ncbi:hypothetical protein D3C75_1187160 [compost metagenome]
MVLMRLPVQGEQPFGTAAEKLLFAQGDMVLAASIGRAGDVTVRHQRPGTGGCPQPFEQAVLACSGWAHQVDEIGHQNTCLPWRQTFCT